ncbi:TIGR04028 family ABC transporter substrate-binding protein [Agrococcus sediminis]|uniref:TIGR04028 family ABC transporter substrate-binding protein n=1 Tax=Agrococcus sediminis TaxID=2599924 RepID=A0A5M8QRU0_9MICO|nr:TIGR04028 family ABC transporter substrate-binding protein [Agrococcus sediminis]KAA6437931.1 TIGR04028 family ABC transporter substrate-binding protein [Agrococcus sediminis]
MVHSTSPRRVGIAGALVAALALSACSASEASSPAAGGDGEPVVGGTLTYLEHQAYTSLYPPSAGFYPNGALVNNLTARLLHQDPETLELEPWIATALPEVNDDATEYAFDIRTDVTYSDGTPLTAENVVANIELFGTGDTDRALIVSEAINDFTAGEVVDEDTVRFTFSAPAPGFAQAVSTINSGLLADATLERDSEGFGPGNATEIIGAGPFVVESEEVGTSIRLAAREDYAWAPASAENQGRPYVDAVDIVIAPEDSVRIGALTSGQAHIARQVEPQHEAEVSAAGIPIVAAETNGVNNGLSFRFGHPLLEDIRVRQALIAGIDREAIVSSIFSEQYPLATSSLSQTALGYADQGDAYAFDPELANRLLDEAGWEPGADGIRVRDGERLHLVVNEALPQPRSRDVITLVAQQLREVGVELELFQGDQAAQTAASADVEQIQIYHSMVGRADFDVIKSQYSIENRSTLQNADADGEPIDAELEELLQRVASEPTVDGREEASAAIQAHLTEQAYVLPFFEEPQVYGVQPNVQGFRTESVGRPSLAAVWLED